MSKNGFRERFWYAVLMRELGVQFWCGDLVFDGFHCLVLVCSFDVRFWSMVLGFRVLCAPFQCVVLVCGLGA